ncbi:hypothetical protein QLQ12_35795 [Actinoplanes sp. NEAU-A12]|uniref:Secreted protein n=1 Tax=Actinoplanes sandaracinus TaxID=3045177 RepID=A0ABT6WW44_9ACTN|nr:hypothetical protein [Actinoplanes sandaracinus]MDI6103968.1 hypothetical protein [Actinoplanes sandaracinus]
MNTDHPGPPVWLLDVDGVINANRPGWHAAPRRSMVYSAQDRCEYRLRWAPTLIHRLRRLHASSAVELRWCTTWCPEAHLLERLWRLPPLARALTCDPVPKGTHAHPLKLDAARQVLAAGRPLIWTDDEAVPTDGPVFAELTAHGQALLIAPSSSRGLQPADLDAVEAFTVRHARP